MFLIPAIEDIHLSKSHMTGFLMETEMDKEGKDINDRNFIMSADIEIHYKVHLQDAKINVYY